MDRDFPWENKLTHTHVNRRRGGDTKELWRLRLGCRTKKHANGYHNLTLMNTNQRRYTTAQPCCESVTTHCHAKISSDYCTI